MHVEVVDPVEDETQLNDRIFESINAWLEGDPVARATTEKWGVPLRTKDAAELEFRERYLEQAAHAVRIGQPVYPYPGMMVCHSGRTSNRPRCGRVLNYAEEMWYTINSLALLAELAFSDNLTYVVEGVRITDTAGEHLGAVVVDDRLRALAVAGDDLGQILEDRERLDALAGAGRGEPVQLGKGGDVRRPSRTINNGGWRGPARPTPRWRGWLVGAPCLVSAWR